MAKFKRLSRFLQRIGIKKKQQSQNDESVDLSRRSWSSRLLKILKIKSRRSGNVAGDHGDHDDAASADSTSDSPQCSSVTVNNQNEEIMVGQLLTMDLASPDQVSAIEEGPILIPTEVSCQWASHYNTIMSASCSDLTSVTELSDYQLCEGEISVVSSELSLTDTDDQDTSSFTISITSFEEFMDITENGSEGTQFEGVYQSAEPVWIQSGHDHKELFDEDEEPQSNTIDDNIILFLPVIVTLVLTLCIYLLYLIC